MGDVKIKIVTSDGHTVETTMKLIGMCKVLADAFEGNEENEDNEPITLNKVDKKETDLQVPLPPCEKLEFIKNEWERGFMEKIPIEEVVPLLEAANAVDCPALFELCAATASAQFRG